MAIRNRTVSPGEETPRLNVAQKLGHKISDGLSSTEVPPSAATVCHQNACFSPVPVVLQPASDARTQSLLL
jgi:hypothetical protein